MQPSTLKLIDCVRQTLREHIAPACPATSAQLQLIDVVLRELAARAGDRREKLRGALQAQVELIQRGRALLVAAKLSIAPDDSKTPRPAHSAGWEEIQAACDAKNVELVAMIEAIVARVPAADPDWAAAAKKWVHAVIHAEMAHIGRLSDEPSRDGAPMPADDLRSPRMAHYLSRSLEFREGSVLSFESLSGGFSRETILLRATHGGEESSWILRKEKKSGLLENVALSLSSEFSVLKLLHGKGLPIPRTFAYQPDEELIGGAFVIVERMPGIGLGSPVKAVGLNAAVMRDIAEVLARLHTTPWREHRVELSAAVGFPNAEKLTIRATFTNILNRWRLLLERKDIARSPAIAAGLQWLSANIPETPNELSVVHGDYGIHNMLFQDDRMTALLDWEHASLGHPARDLVQIRRQLSRDVEWSRFMQWYREGGAPDVSDEVLRYYEVYSATTAMITMQAALECQFEIEEPAQIRYLELGLGYMGFYAPLLETAAAPLWN
jgi:aminoglycoside phosphotransferase (APT) family kinase protein